ncbi:MAG TPA: histidine phosphatase family protein [Gemmatimonadaceae bacterium]
MSDGTPQTIVYLVRHGETEWNAAGRCQGRADADFTEAGREQLRALATELRDVSFDAAYSSSLPRSIRTAAAILQGRPLLARQVDDLSELSYGSLQGSKFSDWPASLHDTWRREPWSVTFPDGESLAMVEQRVLRALDEIISAHPGQTVLVSSHGHVNRLILAAYHNRPHSDFWSIEQINGCATRLECRAGYSK